MSDHSLVVEVAGTEADHKAPCLVEEKEVLLHGHQETATEEAEDATLGRHPVV